MVVINESLVLVEVVDPRRDVVWRLPHLEKCRHFASMVVLPSPSSVLLPFSKQPGQRQEESQLLFMGGRDRVCGEGNCFRESIESLSFLELSMTTIQQVLDDCKGTVATLQSSIQQRQQRQEEEEQQQVQPTPSPPPSRRRRRLRRRMRLFCPLTAKTKDQTTTMTTSMTTKTILLSAAGAATRTRTKSIIQQPLQDDLDAILSKQEKMQSLSNTLLFYYLTRRPPLLLL